MMLNATFLSALLGAVLVLMLPARWAKGSKWIALASALTGFGFAAAAFSGYAERCESKHHATAG
jgi:hypothetical protein